MNDLDLKALQDLVRPAGLGVDRDGPNFVLYATKPGKTPQVIGEGLGPIGVRDAMLKYLVEQNPLLSDSNPMRSTLDVCIAVQSCRPATEREMRCCIASLVAIEHLLKGVIRGFIREPELSATPLMTIAVERQLERIVRGKAMPMNDWLTNRHIPGTQEQIHELEWTRRSAHRATGIDFEFLPDAFRTPGGIGTLAHNLRVASETLVCDRCESPCRPLDADWRSEGGKWRHRCRDVAPQTGHIGTGVPRTDSNPGKDE